MRLAILLTIGLAALAHAEPTTQPATLKPVAVIASAAESVAAGGFGDFPPDKTVDGDLSANSNWRAEIHDEKEGQWIEYDLGSARQVAAVRIAFLKGEDRVYRFSIETSADRTTWTSFRSRSSGKDKGFETFAIPPAEARYVRLRGFGNSSEKFPKWFNILETEIIPAK